MEKEGENPIKLFEDYKVRTSWDNEKETWYFSVEDIVFVPTESADTKQYVKKMRKRDPELNFNMDTICTHIEMIAKNGRNRKISKNCSTLQSLLTSVRLNFYLLIFLFL